MTDDAPEHDDPRRLVDQAAGLEAACDALARDLLAQAAAMLQGILQEELDRRAAPEPPPRAES